MQKVLLQSNATVNNGPGHLWAPTPTQDSAQEVQFGEATVEFQVEGESVTVGGGDSKMNYSQKRLNYNFIEQ